MNCSNCQFEYEGNFCPNCGQKSNIAINPVDNNFPINGDNHVIVDNSQSAPVVAPQKGNPCSVLAIIFGSIGMVPGLNFLFLPPAIVLAAVGLGVCKGRKKGSTIASLIVVIISILLSILWLVPMTDAFRDFNFSSYY